MFTSHVYQSCLLVPLFDIHTEARGQAQLSCIWTFALIKIWCFAQRHKSKMKSQQQGDLKPSS